MTPSAALAWNSTTSRARGALEELKKSSEKPLRWAEAGLGPDRDERVEDRPSREDLPGSPVALATAIGDYLQRLGIRTQSGAPRDVPPAQTGVAPATPAVTPPRGEANTARRLPLLELAR
jgi:hypothetical protein